MRRWSITAGRRLAAALLISLIVGMSLPTVADADTYFAVTFAENASGSDPLVTSQSSSVPAQLTSFVNLTRTFSKLGFAFTGWNTAADGSGTTYADGALYSFATDLTLYAQWTASAGLVTFSSNGGSGSVSSLSAPIGSSVSLPGADSLSLANNTFKDWNSSAGGGGTSYGVGASFVVNSATTLFAQWTANGSTSGSSGPIYVVTLDGGSGVGSLGPISTSEGLSIQLPSSDGLSRPGYTFVGWYSAETGGTLLGLAGASFVPTSSVVIFAQWNANSKVTVSFSSNHGKGAVSAVSGLVGTTITLPKSVAFTYAGFAFVGWNTSAVASGRSFADGSTLTLSGTMTLYAQWSAVQLGKGHSLLIGAVGPFAKGSSLLTNPLKVQVRRIAMAMKSKRYVSASLYGYDTVNGTPAHSMALSARRAVAVVFYLRAQLVALRVKSVTMRSAGEGALRGSTVATLRRVEIFVK